MKRWEKVTGVAVGFAGPIGLKIDVIVDSEGRDEKFCCGSK